jgi:hypothetical protein
MRSFSFDRCAVGAGLGIGFRRIRGSVEGGQKPPGLSDGSEAFPAASGEDEGWFPFPSISAITENLRWSLVLLSTGVCMTVPDDSRATISGRSSGGEVGGIVVCVTAGGVVCKPGRLE